MTVDAIWDTGSRHTLVSTAVVRKLGLAPVSFLKINTMPAYLANLHFTDTFILSTLPVAVMDTPVDSSFDLVLGMDVISIGEFSVTTIGHETWVSYRRP